MFLQISTTESGKEIKLKEIYWNFTVKVMGCCTNWNYIFSRSQIKGMDKVNKDLEEKVHSFIENHPNVVQSPIMNDGVSQ